MLPVCFIEFLNRLVCFDVFNQFGMYLVGVDIFDGARHWFSDVSRQLSGSSNGHGLPLLCESSLLVNPRKHVVVTKGCDYSDLSSFGANRGL